MKKNSISYQILTLLIILSSFSFESTIYPQHLEQYTVNKINSSIVIDGILDEGDWEKAEQTKNFVILGDTHTPAKTITWAKMLWDENYLYVGFYCEDSKIWATYLDRDAPLYKEDVVEVYIDPDADGETYLEVEVSPVNTIFDLWLTKPWSDGGQGVFEWTMNGLMTECTYNGTLNSNSDQDNSWICEMAMPFEAMEFAAGSMNFPPLVNDSWRFNLYRFDRASNNDPNGEATGWSPTNGGQHEPQNFGKITFAESVTDIAKSFESETVENEFILHQNYPNPFNPVTTIGYTLTHSGFVKIIVYDILGREILTLVNEHKPAGNYSVKFNAKTLQSGSYIYRMETSSGFTDTKKLVLLK